MNDIMRFICFMGGLFVWFPINVGVWAWLMVRANNGESAECSDAQSAWIMITYAIGACVIGHAIL